MKKRGEVLLVKYFKRSILSKIFVLLLVQAMLVTNVVWAGETLSQDTLAPEVNISNDFLKRYFSQAQLDMLHDYTIPLKTRDAIHQDIIDSRLAELYKRGKIKNLNEDVALLEIELVTQYLFGYRGLNISNAALFDLFFKLVYKAGGAKIVYANANEWPVKGHASNYGENNARIYVRRDDKNDNYDSAAIFIHELGALLGKSSEFNEKLTTGFKTWVATGIVLHEDKLRKELKTAKLQRNLKKLKRRDFMCCWRVNLPKKEALIIEQAI